MLRLGKRILRDILAALNLELIEKGSMASLGGRVASLEKHIADMTGRESLVRATMRGFLLHAIESGLMTSTVIDVGAAHGTQVLYDLLSGAHFLLIEPLAEFADELGRIVKKLGSAEYIMAAATGKKGSATVNVYPDLFGSSVYRSEEDPLANGIGKAVPALTLNEICSERKVKPPFLIRIDAQGSELDVLEGADAVIPFTELVVIETALFEFYKGAPLIRDCIEFMERSGFVVYDILDLQYRPLDGAMSRAGIAFVKKNSALRKWRSYLNEQQREILYRCSGAGYRSEG